MTTYHTADTHFGHLNILRYDNRPASTIEEHDRMLVERWNNVVMSWDTVIHHGDVALGTFVESIQKVHLLNGYKVLVSGNHDRISSVEKESRRERFRPYYESVFQEIWPEVVEHEINGRKVVLSHYPAEGDHTDEDRFVDIRPKDTGIPVLHGHTHQSEVVSYTKNGTMQIHVGVNSWDYRPVSEEEIDDFLRMADSRA